MSSMAPEGNANPTGGTPMGSGGGGGGSRGPGRRGNATGAASRIAIDTRDLVKMKDLVTGNVTAMKELAKAIRDLDPAVGSLKAVNSELDKMHQMFGLVGGAASGGSRSGSSGGVGASNQKASYTPQSGTQTGVGTPGRQSYSPAPANSGPNGGYNFGGTPSVNLGNPGMRPTSPSFMQRASAYMSAPISDPKSQYSGMSRGSALATEGLASAAVTRVQRWR